MTPPRERSIAATDDQIFAYTVGDKPEPYAFKVVIADYDPVWPQWFEEEADRIRTALGPRAVRIDHVGSTSVPGLAAKPIIDMSLAVPDSSDEDSYVSALREAGYRFQVREPEWHAHRCFYSRLAKGHHRDVNLHIYTVGCFEMERCVVFRDRLRTHDGDRALYQSTKQDLAKQNWKFVQNYADAKTPVIEEIMGRAGEVPTTCAVY